MSAGTWPAIAARKTFINAFESSPVHCAKSRPSGKHHKPGSKGAAEILAEAQRAQRDTLFEDSPAVNVIHYLLCTSLSMNENEIFVYPGDEMVFEGSFDDLMEEVGREKLVNIRSRKLMSKGLRSRSV